MLGNCILGGAVRSGITSKKASLKEEGTMVGVESQVPVAGSLFGIC